MVERGSPGSVVVHVSYVPAGEETHPESEKHSSSHGSDDNVDVCIHTVKGK